jgi:hypothetical protein
MISLNNILKSLIKILLTFNPNKNLIKTMLLYQGYLQMILMISVQKIN